MKRCAANIGMGEGGKIHHVLIGAALLLLAVPSSGAIVPPTVPTGPYVGMGSVTVAPFTGDTPLFTCELDVIAVISPHMPMDPTQASWQVDLWFPDETPRFETCHHAYSSLYGVEGSAAEGFVWDFDVDCNVHSLRIGPLGEETTLSLERKNVCYDWGVILTGTLDFAGPRPAL